VLFSKEKNTELSEREIEYEFVLASVDLDSCSSNFLSMSPPRVGVPSRTRQNKQSITRVPQTRTNEMPTVVYVDKIHTPEYEQMTLHVKRIRNLHKSPSSHKRMPNKKN
jgi:hypothetical protein